MCDIVPPQMPEQGWLCYDVKKEVGSMERINSCPGELSEPEIAKKNKDIT